MHGYRTGLLTTLILGAGLPCALSSLTTPAHAETRAEARQHKQSELRDIQGRIDSLRKEIAKGEESREEAADSLRETESAISAANRRLRELGEDRAALRQELSDLDVQTQKLGKQITAQQTQIGGLLYRQHLRGDADALQSLLAGKDPNQTARDYHYLTMLSKAKADLLGALRVSLAEKQQIAEAVRDRTEQLAENERKHQEQRQALLNQQRQRAAVLAKIAGKIKSQRKEVETLKQNEKRLGKLIDGLSRLIAKAPKKRPAKPATKPGASQNKQGGKESPSIRNEREPEINDSGEFAALRGKLRLPVRGDITHRYGSARPEGGTTWKGVFIRTHEGSEVKSIAAGQVVFSDWLRGFGNLLIVDHGDGYLTVYGNNQSLFKQAGDNVKAGEVVASVGNSGGNPESGLYFELRHRGQTLDPMKWVSLR